MPLSPKKKSAATTSTRVRDNQRRCRARKREYILELEHKLQEYQVSGVQSKANACESTVKRLEDENRKLRELLGQVGVSEACINTHLGEKFDVQGPFITENKLGELLPKDTDVTTSSILDGFSKSPVPSPSPSFIDFLDVPFFSLPEGNPLEPSEIIHMPLTDFQEIMPAAEVEFSKETDMNFICPSPSSYNIDALNFWLPAPFSALPGDSLARRTTQIKSGTTLCVLAYEMIRQHNKKGADMIEIGIRLWNGFIKGDGDEGCKVENKLLSNVLEDISCGEYHLVENTT